MPSAAKAGSCKSDQLSSYRGHSSVPQGISGRPTSSLPACLGKSCLQQPRLDAANLINHLLIGGRGSKVSNVATRSSNQLIFGDSSLRGRRQRRQPVNIYIYIYIWTNKNIYVILSHSLYIYIYIYISLYIYIYIYTYTYAYIHIH